MARTRDSLQKGTPNFVISRVQTRDFCSLFTHTRTHQSQHYCAQCENVTVVCGGVYSFYSPNKRKRGQISRTRIEVAEWTEEERGRMNRRTFFCAQRACVFSSTRLTLFVVSESICAQINTLVYAFSLYPLVLYRI